MFEHCNTLAELNQARAEAVKEGHDKLTVNSAYNSARVRILNSRNQFNDIPVFKRTAGDIPMYCAMPIVGISADPRVIEFTAQGVLV